MNSAEQLRILLMQVHRRALLVGIGGAVACVVAALMAPERFFPAYLVAFLFWTGISLGALAISMLHHITGGGWGIPIRRILESAASVISLMALLFLPIAYGLAKLYSWSDATVVASDEILQRKTHYLNTDSFFARAAIYFGIWILATQLLNGATATSDLALQQRRQRGLVPGSGLGLILWGLTVTFASVDWAMSLEPHWFSSMYGVLFMAGQAVSALALSIVVGVWLAESQTSVAERETTDLSTARLLDLANLLLALVMFWSYVSFMQFLIIWSANLPEETPWYLRRSQGGWQFVVLLLMGLHFLLPILLLLMRQMKCNAPKLLRLAVLLLVMRLVDLSWLVLPTFIPNLTLRRQISASAHEHWERASSLWDLWPLLVTVPAVGGLWVAIFSWRLSVRRAMPVYEFSLAQERRDELAGHAAT